MSISRLFRAAVVCPADEEETAVFSRAELDLLRRVAGGPPPSDAAVAVCGCGIAYSASEWSGLPYLGVQDGGAHGSAMELRNCTCRSTIAVDAVPPMSDWERLPKTVPAPPMPVECAP